MIPIDERMSSLEARLTAALASSDESTRLRAALAIGADPQPGLVETLIARCAVEPDFFRARHADVGPDSFPAEAHGPEIAR